ncbi:division/cell wall cluster transcriptional repressor MraZ [Cellvibrio sp. OA-2007]|uniref:division/cell wall cluster transcriptional repressor MraZ n=1 Tax=Cellvibrio sp. OA-2007 TaxID=529823 RepID=UPI0009FC84CC|nr:division/cell wall cluster transcriptional repressor MraZ [Cellvibrio sp. OA-2007]
MATGSYSISMDPKGRMAIPARIRDSLLSSGAGSLWVTAHMYERCLLVYAESEWEPVLAKIQALPSGNEQVRKIQRRFMGQAVNLEMDANGRILVPPTLRDFAHLDKKLMLVCLGNKFELWNEDSWNALMDQSIDGDMPAELQNLSF